MAPNPTREERRVQRQRGAATRHIKHGADFNIILPGEDDPAAEPPETSGTPRLDVLPAIRSTRRTPVSRILTNVNDTVSLPIHRSTRRTPTSHPPQAAASVGKRKRGPDAASHEKPKNEPALLPGVNNAIKEEEDLEGSRSLLNIDEGSANDALIEEVENSTVNHQSERGALADAGSRQNGRGRSRTASPLPILSAPEEFNDDHEQVAEKLQTQKILAFVRPPLIHSPLNSNSGDMEMGENPETFTDASQRLPEDALSRENSKFSVHSTRDPDQQASAVNLTEPKKKRRKKRKAIGQQRPKPKKTSPALNRALPSRPKSVHTKRSSVTASQTSELHDDDHQTQPYTSPPLPPKAPSKRAVAPKVPITIFRPSKGLSPPTLSPSDVETAPLPPQTDAITPVDVLSQITRELISQTSSNPRLSESSRRTIELYGEELDAHLRMLGQTGATCKALEKRVKGLASEERKVRKAIAEVSRERKKVKEEIERARREGEERSLEALLKDIAGAARRGWEKEGVRVREVSA